MAVIRATDSLQPLAWLAERFKGNVVYPEQLTATDPEPESDSLKSGERTMVELAELDSSIARSLLDDTISAEEHALLRSEWEDVIGWMQRFVARW